MTGQHPGRHLDRVGGRQGGGVLGGPGQPGQVARRPRRQRAGRAGQPEGARHHAADQGGEQQQVDGGEPGRAEDVEEPEVVQPGRQGRMGGVVLLHASRIVALLRQHRPGHAAQGQQEQQDQRDPHGGELAPRPLQPVGEPERTATRRCPARARLVVRFGGRVERICLRRAHIGHRLTAPRLRGDLRQDRGQFRIRGGAEDRARDVPGTVDHQRGRGPLERNHGGEIEGDLLAGIVHARVRDAEVAGECLGAGRRVTLVHAEEGSRPPAGTA